MHTRVIITVMLLHRVYVLKHKSVLGPSGSHFIPCLAAWAKMTLSWAQHIFMLTNITVNTAFFFSETTVSLHVMHFSDKLLHACCIQLRPITYHRDIRFLDFFWHLAESSWIVHPHCYPNVFCNPECLSQVQIKEKHIKFDLKTLQTLIQSYNKQFK